MAFQTGT